MRRNDTALGRAKVAILTAGCRNRDQRECDITNFAKTVGLAGVLAVALAAAKPAPSAPEDDRAVREGQAVMTELDANASALPASSFATGSGVINMVRQIGFAVGVAIFVAIVGSLSSAEAPMAAFRLAWWVMTVITALGLLPLLLLRRWRYTPAVMEPA